MKFIVDENIGIRVVEFLRAEKHDVLYVTEKIKSFDDISVLKTALKKNAFLLLKIRISEVWYLEKIFRIAELFF